MKTPWTPTLTVKEALAICGPLSNPGKMPCHGYALPAQRCRLGSFLQQLAKAICHHCYALRGRYLFPKVRAAMERRIKSLSDPRWADAISTLIYRSGDRYFRWHDSGDLQSIEHLRKIIQVCNFLPRVTLAAHQGISHRRGLSACWRTNPTESLYPLICSSHRRQASAWLWTTGEHRIFSKHRHSFGSPYLSGTEAE